MSKITIYWAWKAQIALLLVEKIIILAKYADLANKFFKKAAMIFPERIDIIEHIIQ